MDLFSSRDAKTSAETYRADQRLVAPDFEETFDASLDFARDEMLSLSTYLNQQGFWNRQNQIQKMKDNGFDFTPYTDDAGKINYDQVARKDELVKTDAQLRIERNEILGKRREYNQDIMERGSALGTFAGMGTAVMFNDPINISTLPIGFGTAAKGLTVLAHTLRGARNTAAIAVSTELAIQPLVYKHKHDINSAYEVSDAINVIAITALSAGVLGGAVGGIGGYFTRAAEVAATEAVRFKTIGRQIPASVYGRGFSVRPDPMQFVQLTPTGATARKLDQKFVKFTSTGKIDPRYRPTFESISPGIIKDAKVQLAEIAKTKLSRGTIKSINAEILELSQARNKLTRANVMRNSTGKIITTAARAAKSKPVRTKRAKEAAEIQTKIDALNLRLKENEGAARAFGDLERLKQGVIPAPIQKEIDAILKQTELGESASIMQRMADSLTKERGFVASDLPLQIYKIAKNGGKTNVEAKAMAIKSLNETIANVKTNKQTINGVVQPNKELAKLEELKVNLEKTSPEELDDFMAQLHKTVVENDTTIMQSMVYRQAQASKPNISPSDYALVEVPSAPRAPTTSLERAALDQDGVGKEFDNIMAEYNRLPEKKLYNEAGELIDADDVIKAADDELNGLESIMRCSIG